MGRLDGASAARMGPIYDNDYRRDAQTKRPHRKIYNSETGLLNEKELKETIHFVSECKYTKFLALCQDPPPLKRP
jgi:hypothetical protein